MNMNTRAYCHRPSLFRSGRRVAFLLGLFVVAANAAEPMIVTSASKQFVVRGRPRTSSLTRSGNSSLIYVEPAVLVVACEHVKQALKRELGWGDRWNGTIFVNVHPTRSDREQPELQPFRTTDGWRYRLELPDEIDRARLIESIVEALVVEFADRNAKESSVELPPWLVEGLTAQLMDGALTDLALQPNAMNVAHRPKTDPIETLRQHVQTSGALSIDQLSWAEFDENDSNAALAYHQSAHLFVRELLRLRGGSDSMCAMLAMLPEHLNWQTAFLRGFDTHFHRMVDVEKWWTLAVTRVKSRDSSFQWSAAEAKQQVEDVLYTPMQVQLPGEDAPHMNPVALQTVISDWEFDKQLPLLRTKLAQLQLARVRLTPDVVTLVDEYRRVIATYLQARSHPGRLFRQRNIRAAVSQAIQELNTLDAERVRIPTRLAPAMANKAWTAVREAEQTLAEGGTELAPAAVPLTHP